MQRQMLVSTVWRGQYAQAALSVRQDVNAKLQRLDKWRVTTRSDISILPLIDCTMSEERLIFPRWLCISSLLRGEVSHHERMVILPTARSTVWLTELTSKLYVYCSCLWARLTYSHISYLYITLPSIVDLPLDTLLGQNRSMPRVFQIWLHLLTLAYHDVVCPKINTSSPGANPLIPPSSLDSNERSHQPVHPPCPAMSASPPSKATPAS